MGDLEWYIDSTRLAGTVAAEPDTGSKLFLYVVSITQGQPYIFELIRCCDMAVEDNFI